jgi:tripartite-type tricarboxylate transporter receptor subunit TctC
MRRLPSVFLLLTGLMLSGAGPASAQGNWPERPIRFVVGLAPGGGTDLFTRVVANELAKRLGQPVIVENRPGAGGSIAAGAVAKADADGYTFFVASSSYATTYATHAKLSFDPFKDLKAVAQILSGTFSIVAHPQVAVDDIPSLVQLAKSKPGALMYASSGNGGAGHLGGELFQSQTGVKLTHVPYRGSAPAITDVLAGRVDLMFVELASVAKRIESGELKLIAVTGAKRAASAPQVPTVTEAGIPGYSFSGWAGLLAPSGVPPQIVNRMNREVVGVLNVPEIRQRFSAQGVEAVSGTAADFQSLVHSELTLWKAVATKSNIVAE